MKLRRILLIVKRTELADLLPSRGPGRAGGGNEARLRNLLKQRHPSVARLEPAHEEHLASVRLVRNVLRDRGLDVVERTSPPARPVRGFDLVITVGGDGTLLEASHAVRDRTAVLGVNSAPAFSVGFLTGCRAPTFASTLEALGAGQLRPLEIQRIEVRIGRRLLQEPVLNDVLFCADNPAVTTRFRLITPDGDEQQRSSGIWVSTPAGSTAALRSAGGSTLLLTAKQFAFVVREPYAPPGSGVRITNGVLDDGQVLALECQTPSASVFIDGHHRRYAVPFGERVQFSISNRPLRLVRLKAPLVRNVAL